ncbi:hypothetical protein, partial [Moraxella catarrhalis]|uniref:hypothetical protein n=1 Tax=Moraxella catarrhalis TaxID=480 RepID=UPI000EE88D5F
VNHVTVLEFGDSLRADQVLIDKAEARENITIIKSAATTEITTGHALKLDEDIQQLVKHIQEPLKFQTFVSLSCHNCPDVVQALN